MLQNGPDLEDPKEQILGLGTIIFNFEKRNFSEQVDPSFSVMLQQKVWIRSDRVTPDHVSPVFHQIRFFMGRIVRRIPVFKQRFLEVLQNDILHLTTEQSGELVEVFERLRKYYNRHDAVAEKLKQNYCLELLLLCRDYYTRQERTQMPELSAAPRQEILDAIAYINAHYAEKIDLETIASQIHLSKYYFCRIFREVTGATVLEYLTNVRLTRAGRLLVESSLAIQEIAQKTGFASLVHFSRTYRNAYGVSPSDTRRRRKA